MKILMINVVCGIRSTGRICTDLATALEVQGHEVKIAYGREQVPEQFQKYAIRIGTDLDIRLHGIKARFLDGSGFGSKGATEKFIDWVKEYDPDIIHLHNIHGYYINIEVLFNYLRTCGKKIIWTLHDCWAFTGHSAYCEYMNCEKWINGCYECPNKKEYPQSIIDRSAKNWKIKKQLFTNIPKCTIVTPSKWLAELVNKSFLSQYPLRIIYNGINTDVFNRKQSDIVERLGISGYKIILGVSALWEKRKGLDDFIKLNEILPKDYKIVLVGLSKDQIDRLPKSIIGIRRTNSVDELVELYSAAYVYLNLTYEDNYPTTNLEAIACGTPVITYNSGGSPESAVLFGEVVSKGDIKAIVNLLNKDFNNTMKSKNGIDYKKTTEVYLDLYEEVNV